MAQDVDHVESTESLESALSVEQELDALQQEFKALTIAHKKLKREMDLAQAQIHRNKIASEAKENLNRVISSKRSELERYMNLLLGNSPDIILLFDRDWKLVHCTESFLALCQIPGFGIIRGTPCFDLLSPLVTQEFRDALQSFLDESPNERQRRDLSTVLDFSGTGDFRNYSVQLVSMVGDSGTREGALIVFTDNTEILAAQQEAERANAAKSDFLATVSHEIRTPMNAIIGLSDMLKATGLTQQQEDYLRTIQDSSHVLLNLINDILDFSKIEAGKLELLPDYFRLSALYKHLRSMFELLFQQKGLNFFCSYEKDLPSVVYGDDKRIRQVMTNILNNALKYTKSGSVYLRVFQDQGYICFAVRDTGIGIKEEAIPRLFSAFEQLDQVRNKGVVGTGLGLAITKKLCEMMEGTIEVESEYNVGSCFTVRLPMSYGQESDLPPEEGQVSTRFHAPEARVLLVDDIEINLQIAAYMLSIYGITPDTATSGADAISLVREKEYDIIFMDHMMPEMDGIETTAKIRGLDLGFTDRVPIVALTANAVSGAADSFFANGFQDFLSKPMDSAALAQCLLKWLPQEVIQREE